MLKRHFRKLFISLFILHIFSIAANTQFNQGYPQQWNYGIEINDVLCGYSETSLDLGLVKGQEQLIMKDHILVRLSVLGGGVDMTIDNEFILDPETKVPFSIQHNVITSAELYAYSRFDGNKVYFTTVKGGELEEITLPEGTLIENSYTFPHLIQDFVKGDLKEKTYQVFDDMRGVVATKLYHRVGEEEIELSGRHFKVLVLDEINHHLGTTSRIWLDKENSTVVQTTIAGRRIFLTDPTVKKKINVVDMDNVLFARVDERISNVSAIKYMKVEAEIESSGEWITQEKLNGRGQQFRGTVNENRICGIFEMSLNRYDGKGAPAFPSVISDKTLRKYLEPEPLIESEDPELVREAREITFGANDSWEAAVRLSKWVGENIRGAVPGGTSAINTYHTREGECGSHSRLLTAFCRAVGIPARLSIGCMYSPYLGGSFGQHAWTEVYMGDAGWIAVDATTFEFDFIDAGHIRLGESASFNPKTMRILDYKLNDEDTGIADTSVSFEKYLGSYMLEGANREFNVLYQDGNMVVDIPGQTLLALNEPDEQGIFYPKLTRQVNFSFTEDDKGVVQRMKLQQLVYLRKKSETDEPEKNGNEKLIALTGNYLLSQPPAEFRVFTEKGVLMVNDPLSKQVIKLEQKEDMLHWIDENGKNEIEFQCNPAGEITDMIIYVNLYMDKQ